MPTRFRMPPESWAGYFSIVSGGRFTSRMHSAMRSRQYSRSPILVLVGDAQPHVLEDIHRVEQRSILEDVADLGAELRQLLPLERAHILAVHDDGAADPAGSGR